MGKTLPLDALKAGRTAIVQDLRGGYGFRSRLASLGFTPGTTVTMLQNLGGGPLLVSLRDTRIALGRGEARKVLIDLGGKTAHGRA